MIQFFQVSFGHVYWMCQPGEVAGFEHEGIRVAKMEVIFTTFDTQKNMSPTL